MLGIIFKINYNLTFKNDQSFDKCYIVNTKITYATDIADMCEQKDIFELFQKKCF